MTNALCEFLESRRLLSAGGVDPGFHQIVLPDTSMSLVLADGRIIVATGYTQTDTIRFVVLHRYAADGTPDASYLAYVGGDAAQRASASPDQINLLFAADSRERILVSVNEMLYRVDANG